MKHQETPSELVVGPRELPNALEDDGSLSFINLEELEALARAKLPKMVYDYYAGGAETQTTVQENRSAFSR